MSGEYRFSHLPMPRPKNFQQIGGRLTGEVVQSYMESYEQRFLEGITHYGVDVLDISRNQSGEWFVKIREHDSLMEEILQFDKIVLCTGVSIEGSPSL